MFELLVTGLKKYMDSVLVLKNVTFAAYAGEKVGIVGANGSGKSTILKLIAGVEPKIIGPGIPNAQAMAMMKGLYPSLTKPRLPTLSRFPNMTAE
jgi:ABC-type polysaccharide/polyol phosphate transport system ATPase subunit